MNKYQGIPGSTDYWEFTEVYHYIPLSWFLTMKGEDSVVTGFEKYRILRRRICIVHQSRTAINIDALDDVIQKWTERGVFVSGKLRQKFSHFFLNFFAQVCWQRILGFK